MFELAARNKVDIPFKSVEEVRAAYKFTNLQDFLDIYYQGMGVLNTEEDFYELTTAYLQKAHTENIRHTEIFFDPQGHTERGIPFDVAISGIHAALKSAEDTFGMSTGLIMCFLRHMDEASALSALQEAEKHQEKIIGVGLDSSEVGNPPSKFERVFQRAKQMGLKAVAHAGEEGPPNYIYEALDLLKVDRIDHGNRAIEDDTLVSRLVDEGMALTMCPLSNLKLCVHEDLAEHPAKKLLQQGAKVTLNSDDPSYFGGYLNENYVQLSKALRLTTEDLILMAKNSFNASFISDDLKQTRVDEIDEYSSQFQGAGM